MRAAVDVADARARNRVFVSYVSSVLVLCLLLYLVVGAFTQRMSQATWALAVLVLLCLAGARVALWAGRDSLAFVLFTSTFATAPGGFLILEGPGTAHAGILFMLIVVAGGLLRPRAVLLFTAIAVASVLGAFWAESNHWLPLRAPPTARDPAALPLQLVLTGVMAALFARGFRRAVRSLREQRELLDEVVDHTPDGLLLLDAQGKIVVANPVARQLLCEPHKPCRGQKISELLRLEPLSEMGSSQLHDEILAGLPRAGLFRMRVGDDAREPRAVELACQELEGGDLGPRYQVTIRDVTEQRSLQERAQGAQRLQTAGRLAASVAHDFNNYLTVVLSSAELMKLASDDPEVIEQVDTLLEAVKRSTSLTRQLLVFTRQEPGAKRVELSPEKVIEDLERILTRLVRPGVELQFRLATPSTRISIDAVRLEQAVSNLVLNASDAIVDGGRVVVSTRADDDSVVIAVEDTGPGMDETTQRRVFEPFFSTKAPGKGTGLGLTNVATIVAEAGGRVELTSELGRGTRFEMWFPRAPGEPVSPVEPEAASPPRGDGQTVLVCDDDEVLGKQVQRLLTRGGYRALVASTPAAALEIARDQPERIQLLVSDVVMPQVSGPELAAQLRQACPGLSVLYMSGYSAGVELGADDPILQKPFSPDVLLRAVAAALEASAPS